jgi:Polyphosphate kinase
VLVEIKARFDEQANIGWAKRLEQAGAHVVYGLLGLKTHCKTLLVVRREGSLLRRYVHIGTGNYNTKTARTYVDLGLFTCRQDIGADVSDLFNLLTGLSRQRTFRRLIIAPTGMRDAFLALVEREIEHARAGRPARIILKMNAIVDRLCVEALYRASTAGVDIDLIVRGACTAVPEVEGVSERLRVRSIVGEFLEHSRIWSFENGGEREWYIGSADLMDRNLDRGSRRSRRSRTTMRSTAWPRSSTSCWPMTAARGSSAGRLVGPDRDDRRAGRARSTRSRS